MAKIQTRRSVSLRGLTYQRLKNHCESTGESVSGYLEILIGADLTARGVPVPDKIEPTPPKQPPPTDDEVDEISSQHFTF